MIEATAFQTRARTVDHLGREQIADCPTAVSELWKNAFDAYARSVELTIFAPVEDAAPVAAVADDGHGMNRQEFLDRWLVVGTESKLTPSGTSAADRNGLRPRPRQGQKGIGRLSCANLGHTLLLVSKRKTAPFVAALVDWRLFENPFSNLSDIFIPIAEFSSAGDLFGLLPELAASLAENVTGGRERARRDRLRSAWTAFDELSAHEPRGDGAAVEPPSIAILSTIRKLPYRRHHLQEWPVFTGRAEHGTALLIAGLNHDLRVHLDDTDTDSAGRAAKKLFFETLSSFVDPYVDPSAPESDCESSQFSYAVRTWSPKGSSLVLGSDKQFDKRLTDRMEHRLEGTVNARGIFVGRVRAFGQWLPAKCEIPPPKDLAIPQRRDTFFGAFELYIASMEFRRTATTHTDFDFGQYRGLASKYSGFMLFRDGLRVLPYGRPDNDFFEIESRRSKHVGREFWNHRQMFGRIAITREANPNLKDKAGREGLIDNRAAQTLKKLVSNILMASARRYFGSESPVRQELLPPITTADRKRRAAEARQRLRQRHRREFRARLRHNLSALPAWLEEVQVYRQGLELKTEPQITDARRQLEEFRDNLGDLRFVDAPEDLGDLDQAYADYGALLRRGQITIAELSETIGERIAASGPSVSTKLLERQLESQAGQLDRRLRVWKTTIDELYRAEGHRLTVLIARRKAQFRMDARPLLDRFRLGRSSYAESSRLMDGVKESLDNENRDLFSSYIGALRSLQENIDLEVLARVGIAELGDLRDQLERLNSLAQLGIAVEITAHELQAYDDMIGAGLRALPDAVQSTQAVTEIVLGYEGLTDQLRFLSPLGLAGPKTQRWISGQEIGEYLSKFFASLLVRNRISFVATDAFRTVRIFEQRSRLYPVFINLVNNSVYWLSTASRDDRQILIDVVHEDVVVSDNGPGVSPEDIDSLFQLFFTRKSHGGRGVGLYLCRANLASGGHTIRYEANSSNMPLDGANFLITFNGADFGSGTTL